MTNDDHRRKVNHVRELAARWRQLSKQDRLVYLWRTMGFREEEIAAEVGKSLSAVRAAYRRAVASMQ